MHTGGQELTGVGIGIDHRVRVKANGLTDRSPRPTFLSYSRVPRIEFISGCVGAGMSTAECWRNGMQELNLIGYDLWMQEAEKLEQFHQTLSVCLHRCNARAILRRCPAVPPPASAAAAAQAALASAEAERSAGAVCLDQAH
eukprot:gene58085-biopygen29668